MKRVRIDDVHNSLQPAAIMRSLTEPLGVTDLSINYYELEPGDSFSFAYHNHEIQEEVFYIQAGTATFDTEDGSVVVDAGEIIRFDRGEFQRGWNRGEETVVAIALGAPLEYGTQVTLRYCAHCEDRTDNDLDRETDEEGNEVTVATCCVCSRETGRWYRGSMAGTVP